MRTVLLAITLTLLSSCYSTPQRVVQTTEEIIEQQEIQIQEAAGAVYATGILLREGHVEAAQQTTDFAQAALPRATVTTLNKWKARAAALIDGSADALAQAYADLEASQVKTRNLEEELGRLQSKLLAEEQEKTRLAEEALRKEQENRRIQERQTMALTWFGGALAVAGVLAGWFGKHLRLGIIMVGLGVGLITLGSMLARIPPWAGTAFTITGFTLVPLVGYYTYRVGLFQNPPEKVGDFKVA